jgi:hypothetical protein
MRYALREPPVTDRNYDFDMDSFFFTYEDELPDDMTDMDYGAWFELSWVDLVRIGPPPVRRTAEPT